MSDKKDGERKLARLQKEAASAGERVATLEGELARLDGEFVSLQAEEQVLAEQECEQEVRAFGQGDATAEGPLARVQSGITRCLSQQEGKALRAKAVAEVELPAARAAFKAKQTAAEECEFDALSDVLEEFEKQVAPVRARLSAIRAGWAGADEGPARRADLYRRELWEQRAAQVGHRRRGGAAPVMAPAAPYVAPVIQEYHIDGGDVKSGVEELAGMTITRTISED